MINDAQRGAHRFADADTAARYPLPCANQSPWLETAGGTQAHVEIGALAAHGILIPSLSGWQGGYRFTLVADQQRWELPRVRALDEARALHEAPLADDKTWQPAREGTSADNAVTTHVDCFHIHRALSGVKLEVNLDPAPPPRRFLLTASWRPLELPSPGLPTARVLANPPPAASQMSQGGRDGPRICSPTCVAMVLRGYGRSIELLEASAQAFDPNTNLYGVWPYALRLAGAYGHLGAVEAVADWDTAQQVLEQGYPLVASIRFRRDALPGAPLQSTAGHLVVLHGAAPDCVVVNDPAAPQVATVPRTYASGAFSSAWLQYRGAAYILLP